MLKETIQLYKDIYSQLYSSLKGDSLNRFYQGWKSSRQHIIKNGCDGE